MQSRHVRTSGAHPHMYPIARKEGLTPCVSRGRYCKQLKIALTFRLLVRFSEFALSKPRSIFDGLLNSLLPSARFSLFADPTNFRRRRGGEFACFLSPRRRGRGRGRRRLPAFLLLSCLSALFCSCQSFYWS